MDPRAPIHPKPEFFKFLEASGARVGVGMLRGKGIPLPENTKRFLASTVSEFENLKVSVFQISNISK